MLWSARWRPSVALWAPPTVAGGRVGWVGCMNGGFKFGVCGEGFWVGVGCGGLCVFGESLVLVGNLGGVCALGEYEQCPWRF